MPQIIRKGIHNEAVKLLQERLNHHDGYHLVVDGGFGAKTKGAVMDFQGTRGLVVDGIVGDKTWDALLSPKPISDTDGSPKLIKRGDEGDEVKVWIELLQKTLNDRGYPAGKADGDFGPTTEQAVILYQQSNNLESDGVVGSQTWNHLLVSERFNPPVDLLQLEKTALLEKARSHIRIEYGDDPDHRESVLERNKMLVLGEAISFLGVCEIPNGSNNGADLLPIVGDYNEYWGIPDKIYRAWCAMFVSQAIRRGLHGEAGEWEDIPFGKFFGGCSQIIRWADGKDCWHANGSDKDVTEFVPAGSIFMMPRSGSGSDASSSMRAGHTGLVVYDDGEAVITIEGNTSNKVMSRRRKKSGLMGFVYWWDA